MPKKAAPKKSLDADGGSVGDLPASDHNPGRGLYRRQLEAFSKLPDKEKHQQLREAWKEVAMGAATRAKQFVATCSPKDFGRLYQLIMTGAVSIDKAFPPKEASTGPAFIVNMFGSLGQRAAAIAMPQTPTVIDITPKEVEWRDSSLTKTETSLPTSTEMSSTTKPLTPSLNTPSP